MSTTTMWYGSYGIQLEFTEEQVGSVVAIGNAEEWVAALLEDPSIRKQLDEISDDALREELDEYGVWDYIELEDRQENERRLVWLAACDVHEAVREGED